MFHLIYTFFILYFGINKERGLWIKKATWKEKNEEYWLLSKQNKNHQHVFSIFFRGCKQANLSTFEVTKISNLLFDVILDALKYQKKGHLNKDDPSINK